MYSEDTDAMIALLDELAQADTGRPSSGAPQTNRRQHRRRPLAFPLAIATKRGEVLGVSHNCSRGGLVVSANRCLHLGERVSVRFHAGGPEQPEIEVESRVLRTDQDARHYLFPHRAALVFRAALSADVHAALTQAYAVPRSRGD